MENKKLWIDINGSIEIDVDDDTFATEFCKWLESKGWAFTGVTAPQEEDPSELYYDDEQEADPEVLKRGYEAMERLTADEENEK